MFPSLSFQFPRGIQQTRYKEHFQRAVINLRGAQIYCNCLVKNSNCALKKVSNLVAVICICQRTGLYIYCIEQMHT